jgi:hypothetical protein
MFSFTHVSSRNIGTKEQPVDVEVKTELTDLPSTIEEMVNNEPRHFEKTIEVCVGKNADGTRRYESLPFWVAMAIEGYKLHVNAMVSPKKATGGMTKDEAMVLIVKLPTELERILATERFDNGTAKQKKATVEALRLLA